MNPHSQQPPGGLPVPSASSSRFHSFASSLKRRALSASGDLSLFAPTPPPDATTTIPDRVILDQLRRQNQWSEQPLLFLEKRIQDLWLVLYLAFRLYQYLWHGVRWWFKFVRLILFAILLLPGFSQMILFYFFSPRLLRSVPYGMKPRNMLDVYLPRRGWRLQGPRPVVVYITGGAWTIGYKAWGALFGRRLSQRGVVVFCLDYRNFPQGNAVDMLEDVNTGIKWVLEHCSEYGGDPGNVWLVGQSAGGHLTAVALLCQAARELCLRYNSNGGGHTTPDACDIGINTRSSLPPPLPPPPLPPPPLPPQEQHQHQNGGIDARSLLQSSSNCTTRSTASPTATITNKNNENSMNETQAWHRDSCCASPHWNPRHLKGYIAVSGAFNLLSLEEHLHRRGLYKNLLSSIMSDHKGVSRIQELSPKHLLETLSLHLKLSSCWPTSTVLLHGTADKSVPIEIAVEFADALCTAGISCSLTTYQGKTHTQPIVEDPMKGGRDVLMDEVLSLVVGEKCYNEQFPMLPSFLIDAATYVCPF